MTGFIMVNTDIQTEAFDQAVDRFQALNTKLGSPEAVKAFFAAYGTEGFAPKPARKADPQVAAKDAKELLKAQNIDLALKHRKEFELGLPVRPPGYGAAYLGHDREIKEIAGVDNPTSLTADAWRALTQANSIFHSFVISDKGTLIRARRPAFELKTEGGKTGTDAIRVVPDFEVFDNSSISINETTSELERSMAQNGFSSLAIQGSISGGAFGVSAAASGGTNTESSTSANKGEFASRKEYTAAYSVGRAFHVSAAKLTKYGNSSLASVSFWTSTLCKSHLDVPVNLQPSEKQ